jgi:radical SAM protein with 4Fe4S-binding SPASM domain
MYFRLNPECYLINGEKNGIILDLLTLTIYSLDSSETKELSNAENNNSVNENSELYITLHKNCLGTFYSNNIFIDKIRLGPLMNIENPVEFNLKNAFLEINNICNRNCFYCGYNGIKRTLGCMGCNKWDDCDDVLSLKKWKSLIDELVNLHCNNIVITGGDLTLEWKKSLEIIKYANGKFDNIQITINQKSLSKKIIQDINGLANLIIQTDNPNDITSKDFIYLLIIQSQNRQYYDKFEGYKNVIFDFIVDGMDDLIDLPIMSKDWIFPVDVYQFFYNLNYHPCMGNIVTITNDGNVLVCPTMRDIKFGNVKEKGLYKILREKKEEINKLWKLNLDHIDKCVGCEFRYVCLDCRSIEKSLNGDLTSKKLCNYNPKKGIWSQ